MQTKFIRYFLGSLIAVVLLVGTFSGGVIVGWAMPGGVPTFLPLTGSGTPAANSQTGATPTNLSTLFSPFWEAWDIIHNQYVDQPVDDTNLMRGAIRGMMESLGDPHSSYMDPEQYKQANSSLAGSYEGIGATVDITGEYLKIVSPMPGSPAEKAGLKPNDQVVGVNGTDVTGVPGDLVLQKILGPAGTSVTLTIERTDPATNQSKKFDVTITREKIVMHSATGKMLDNNIAYVQINTFGDNTTSELRQTLQTLMAQKPNGMILDLRNNGGGYLNTAIEVVSEFVKGGQTVMYEQFGNGTRNTFKTTSGGLATNIPLVVLVNGGSASASEITAGAIQDLGRGKLVGETTYGKGSVQNWIALKDNQGAVRVTIARWLTPKGRQINGKGLEPDVVVKLTDQDVQAGSDPQLDKAVQILSTK